MMDQALDFASLDAATVSIVVAVVAAMTASALFYFFVLRPAMRPLNAIPGPAPSHWFFGSIKDIYDTKWTQGQHPEPLLSWYSPSYTVYNSLTPRSVGSNDTLLTKLTLDIIGVSVFGYDFGALGGQPSILDALKLLLTPPSLLLTVGMNYIPTFRHWPWPRLKARHDAKRKLLAIVDDVIKAKLKAPRDNVAADLVDLLLDDRVSPTEEWTHVLTFMLAGHKRSRRPVQASRGCLRCLPSTLTSKPKPELKPGRRHPSMAHWMASIARAQVPHSHEALRLYPTVAQVSTRVGSADDTQPMSEGKPIFVPKGTTILVSTAAMHRNPKYWTRLYLVRYNPTTSPNGRLRMSGVERFLDGSVEFAADKALRNGQGNTYFYMPLSTGPKNSIGMRFALAEMQVVVATLLLKHSFRLTSEADIHPKMLSVAIKPVHLEMTVHTVA
ncbi:Aste57867_15626 [Aphanomyces stellatus]|uniref:Aste57867_15626 protein n=1 Tax=Aphanomyces stellatus TaxID=120398 RepID=A0A485L4V8_9STRA|nr:hypothetical protein As57867_015570 [Aphanomyces stellatus]VFT92423.1 Aste57867_15626 [Aphanomyces stellatus]